MKHAELVAQEFVCEYITATYPNVLFMSDYASGLKLKPYQAATRAKLNGNRRGFPDLYILESRRGCHGLFIELKAAGTRLTKKNGAWASEHIAEQAKMLEELENRGYIAKFAVGIEAAINLIDDYFDGEAEERF